MKTTIGNLKRIIHEEIAPKKRYLTLDQFSKAAPEAFQSLRLAMSGRDSPFPYNKIESLRFAVSAGQFWAMPSKGAGEMGSLPMVWDAEDHDWTWED